MKRHLRSKVWWTGIDRQVEQFVQICRNGLLVSNTFATIHRELPTGPWLNISIDLFGPLPDNTYVFCIIDYLSRYMEVKYLKSITSYELKIWFHSKK